ncbi:hypothetical protein [Marinobacter sp. LQ44]|uniref:hypothetical protein n=1 Tax=Marinobacter TaxID=2742 RepID=UPI000718EC15|nr:hypothetical protein [Marinobacter sp. LQ44]AMQ88203.1 hypothetical protein ASQ50_05585 [Marinobacter sp. LQ44]
MTSEDNDQNSPGTAAPAKIRKAACGIRFDEEELQEGIDFSAAARLKPNDDAELENTVGPQPDKRQSATNKHR